MGDRVWLMKTEPETFGIDDLARVKVEPWTGVRNFTARNFMRDQMQVGDTVLFYHSNAHPSGVAGLARVHRTGVVDETQFDPASKYFDPKAKRDAPTWICVDVAYVATFPRVVSLAELHTDPRLADMLVLRRGMRLSVQPATAADVAVIQELCERPAPPPARASKGSDGEAPTRRAKPVKRPTSPRRAKPAKAPRAKAAQPSKATKAQRPKARAKVRRSARRGTP